MDKFFSRWASVVAEWTGSPWGFTAAFTLILIWALLGPVVGFSDPWQLAINTGTTIVTFLMVFIIQNSQNRDTRALQVKLDELIRATQGADNRLLDLETLSASEITELHKRYNEIAARAKELGIEFAASADVPPPEITISPHLAEEKGDSATGGGKGRRANDTSMGRRRKRAAPLHP